MRIRHLAAPTAVLLSLSFISGPAFADETEPETDTSETETEECPAPEQDGEPFEEAAATSIAAAEGLTDEEGTCSELESDRERAIDALEAAIERLPDDGAGVAGAVLQALVLGESPAGIGRDHGAAMAQAAAARRDERGHGTGRPEGAVEAEAVEADTPAAPAVTPAVPAVPATPPVDDGVPAVAATPAVPAAPAQPEVPVQRGRPTDS
jgi:hypothetical protein